MLVLDLGVFHRQSHTVKYREALIWSVVWIALALIFAVVIYFWQGVLPRWSSSPDTSSSSPSASTIYSSFC